MPDSRLWLDYPHVGILVVRVDFLQEVEIRFARLLVFEIVLVLSALASLLGSMSSILLPYAFTSFAKKLG
jgi:hypothetical protein